MRLPDKFLEFEGRRIAVTKREQIGDGEGDDTALYTDAEGRFYAVYHKAGRGFTECLRMYMERHEVSGVPFPEAAAEMQELGRYSVRVVRLTDHGALAWYCREFLGDGPLKKLMREAIAGYVPKSERRSKAPVTAWVTNAIAAQLRRAAHAAGLTDQHQLELFIRDGLQRRAVLASGVREPEQLATLTIGYGPGPAKAKAPKARRKKAGTEPGAQMQLQLATALVEVVARFEVLPAPETLAQARRTVSALHQSLHSDAAFKRASVA